MYKVAVLGEYDSIYGFATIGLDTFSVTEPEEGARKLSELVEQQYAVIYITESLAALMPKEIRKYSESLLPAIIQIPGISGNTGAGVTGVKKSVEQAIGSDILFGNNN